MDKIEMIGASIHQSILREREAQHLRQMAQDAERWRKCKRMPKAWWLQAVEEAGLKGGRNLDEIIDAEPK